MSKTIGSKMAGTINTKRFYQKLLASPVLEAYAKSLAPFVLLIFYLIFCSTTFFLFQYFIVTADPSESMVDDSFAIKDDPAPPKSAHCVDWGPAANASFAKAFYFMNTVFFSIGYGDVVPCKWYGKICTIIFALTGVPLTLFCLGRLGRPLKTFLESIWYKYLTVWKGEDEVEQENWALPLPVGITITFIWIFLSSLYFQRTIVNHHNQIVVGSGYGVGNASPLKNGPQPSAFNSQIPPIIIPSALVPNMTAQNGSEDINNLTKTIIAPKKSGYSPKRPENGSAISYLDGVYFTVISLFTIGFGDLTPRDRGLDWLSFSFIFVGLAMVSMCVAIAQRNLEVKFDNLRVLSLMQQFRDGDVKLTDDQSQLMEKVLKTWAFPSHTGLLSAMAEKENRDYSKSPKVILGAFAQGAIIGRWRSNLISREVGVQCDDLIPGLLPIGQNNSSTTITGGITVGLGWPTNISLPSSMINNCSTVPQLKNDNDPITSHSLLTLRVTDPSLPPEAAASMQPNVISPSAPNVPPSNPIRHSNTSSLKRDTPPGKKFHPKRPVTAKKTSLRREPSILDGL